MTYFYRSEHTGLFYCHKNEACWYRFTTVHQEQQTAGKNAKIATDIYPVYNEWQRLTSVHSPIEYTEKSVTSKKIGRKYCYIRCADEKKNSEIHHQHSTFWGCTQFSQNLKRYTINKLNLFPHHCQKTNPTKRHRTLIDLEVHKIEFHIFFFAFGRNFFVPRLSTRAIFVHNIILIFNLLILITHIALKWKRQYVILQKNGYEIGNRKVGRSGEIVYTLFPTEYGAL